MIFRFFSRKISPSDQALHSYLKNLLGYSPRDLALFKRALRHKSAAVLVQEGDRESNERLEYLGDAVLGSVIANYLYLRFPDKDEGFLTKLRSKIVGRAHLNDLAIKMGLDAFIDSNLEDGEKSSSINGNAFEALIGSVFIDRGYNFTDRFILEVLIPKYIDIEKITVLETDFKSKLIEWTQKQKKSIRFQVTETSEDKGDKLYRATVMISQEPTGEGEGPSKKKAEQKAARQAWHKLFNEDLESS